MAWLASVVIFVVFVIVEERHRSLVKRVAALEKAIAHLTGAAPETENEKIRRLLADPDRVAKMLVDLVVAYIEMGMTPEAAVRRAETWLEDLKRRVL